MALDKDQIVPEVTEAPSAPASPETVPLPENKTGRMATNVIKTNEVESELLEEFDFEGRRGKILRLRIKDISPKDLEAHARNLAAMNFKLLPNLPDAAQKAALREKKYIQRERYKNFPILRKLCAISDEQLHEIYPDSTKEEHFRAYRDKSFPRLMEAGNLFAIQVDNRIVATLGAKLMGQTPGGREVYEFEKGSVLNDPKYRGKKLHPRLTKIAFDMTMGKNPDAMWVSASKNPEVLENYGKHGWHTGPMDDPNEAVQVMCTKTGAYVETMKSQGYKAMYLDPKVDQVTWST